MARFEAVFHDEEPGERMAEWHVVEWIDNVGRRISRYYGVSNGPRAIREAAALQAEWEANNKEQQDD